MTEDQFKRLRKKYTDEELAESFVFPIEEEAYQKGQEEIKELRLQQLREMTELERIFAEMARLKYLIEGYLEGNSFRDEFEFGSVLNEYIRIIKKPKKAFAEDIGIHSTRLSRILNNKEDPNMELTYRLEEHSGKLIPAVSWWKLHTRKQEYLILSDQEKRKRESAKVQNQFRFKFSA